jgi:hypothetical protein
MQRRILSAVFVCLFLVCGGAVAQGPINLAASLRGFDEVPAISSFGSGTLTASLNEDLTELTFELTYSGLSGEVTQAHIHLAQPGVNGGIMVFFCSNLGNGPAGTPNCPESGTVSGTRTAEDVVSGANAQGVPAGNFFRLQRALRQGLTYANVHSDRFPGGEIRGQVRVVP